MNGDPMDVSESLVRAASRVSSNPTYMAFTLRIYGGDRFEVGELASALSTDVSKIVRLALCRRPRATAEHFMTDVKAIASGCGVGKDKVAEVVRRADAINALRSSAPVLMAAARDRLDQSESDPTKE